MTIRKTTILLVDDEPQFLESVAERVRLKGFNVITAASGAEAIEKARKQDVQLAVVDLKLPDMEGLVVITKLKELQPHVKTVLLTGFGDTKLEEATKSLNSTYFEKQNMGGFWDFLKRALTLPTVLLVDDEPEFLDTMVERIRLKGFEVATATTGEAALRLAQEQEFDFAVVDLKLPDMDGLVVITKLKEAQPRVRTMLLTGFGTEKLKEAAESLNTAYFEKQDMGGFWSHFRRLSRFLENTMAAAGMAQGGDLNDADKIGHGEDV